MDPPHPTPPHRDLLRAARADRGWSQSEAARRLAALAGGPTGPTGRGGGARPGSLKTQLSRWENGHAVPAPEHRELLAELYERSAAELGLGPAARRAGPAGPAGPDGADRPGGADRLRAALDRAATLDGRAVDLIEDQLRATVALDHRLGTAAAHGALAAQVRELRELVAHDPPPELAPRLTRLLATAALLAGDQRHDRAEPDLAWRSYLLARDTAERAGRPDLAAQADRRLARLRAETPPTTDRAEPGDSPADGPAHDPAQSPVHGPAGFPVDAQGAPVPLEIDRVHEEPSARERTGAAWREALAAHRDGRSAAAVEAAAAARRLALRTGSTRTLALLTELGR